MTTRPGTKLRHFKGKPYQFLFYALHSETLEDYAVYECLYENDRSTLWIRPRSLFEGMLPEASGAPEGRRRFAEVLDEDGEPERLCGLARSQIEGLASRHNALAWQGIDEWQEHSPEEREETLESAYASLALWRETEDELATAKAHWLVAYILLMQGQIEKAALHVEANVRGVTGSKAAAPVDKALSAEIEARFSSVQDEPEAPTKREAAQALIQSLDSKEHQRILLAAFERGPW